MEAKWRLHLPGFISSGAPSSVHRELTKISKILLKYTKEISYQTEPAMESCTTETAVPQTGVLQT